MSRPASRLWSSTSGQPVSLHGTLFDDFLCTVESIDAKDRGCVLLDLMQQTVKLSVPSEVVTAA